MVSSGDSGWKACLPVCLVCHHIPHHTYYSSVGTPQGLCQSPGNGVLINAACRASGSDLIWEPLVKVFPSYVSHCYIHVVLLNAI